jgi:hypothetical protein
MTGGQLLITDLLNMAFCCIVFLLLFEQKGVILLRNIWAERIAEAVLMLYCRRCSFLAVKPKAVHRLVRRFLIDSEAITYLGRLGKLRRGGSADAEDFPRADGRKHLYRLEPERLDEICRWALFNAPRIVVRFRKGVGLRLEPESWDTPPKPDWPWYPE